MPIKMTYDPRQLDKIQRLLLELPVGAKSVVIPALNEYLMGGASGAGGESFHGLKHYPAFVAVPGGQQFPMRTGRLQRGWVVTGEAYRQKISNAVPYACWIHGNKTQTWRAKFGNWRTLSAIVKDNISGAMRHAISKLNDWVKSRL
jgi:hypothetical protein